MSCTICLDQLLEPDPPEQLIVVNNQGSPAFFEKGSLALGLGVDATNVLFTTQKAASDYSFNELRIENTQDPAPLTILPTVVSHSQGGFSVVLNGQTDTVNYVLRWEVNVTSIS